MLKVRVFRFRDAGPWGWECWACHAGESHTLWRHALAEAWQHVDRHQQFGFRPCGRSAP